MVSNLCNYYVRYGDRLSKVKVRVFAFNAHWCRGRVPRTRFTIFVLSFLSCFFFSCLFYLKQKQKQKTIKKKQRTDRKTNRKNGMITMNKEEGGLKNATGRLASHLVRVAIPSSSDRVQDLRGSEICKNKNKNKKIRDTSIQPNTPSATPRGKKRCSRADRGGGRVQTKMEHGGGEKTKDASL